MSEEGRSTASDGSIRRNVTFDANSQFGNGVRFVACNFGQRSKFGNNCSFKNCSFAFEENFFGRNDESNFSFGDNCQFENCDIGAKSMFGKSCEFLGRCKVGPACSIIEVTIDGDIQISFGPACHFRGNCVFSAPACFGPSTQFFGKTIFGNSNSFGVECQFHDSCTFGNNNTFGVKCKFHGQRSQFGNGNIFNVKCEINGDNTEFGNNCVFGIGCKFCNGMIFGKHCSMSMGCSVGNDCIARGHFGSIDGGLAAHIRIVEANKEKVGGNGSNHLHQENGDFSNSRLDCRSMISLGRENEQRGEMNVRNEEREKEKEKENVKEDVKEKEKENEKEEDKDVAINDGTNEDEKDKIENVFEFEDHSLFGVKWMKMVACPDGKGGIIVDVAGGETSLKPGMIVIGMRQNGQRHFFQCYDDLSDYLSKLSINGNGIGISHIVTSSQIGKEISSFPFDTLKESEYKAYIRNYVINENGYHALSKDIARSRAGSPLQADRDKLIYFEKLSSVYGNNSVEKNLDKFKYVKYEIGLGQEREERAESGGSGASRHEEMTGVAYGPNRGSVATGCAQQCRFDGKAD